MLRFSSWPYYGIIAFLFISCSDAPEAFVSDSLVDNINIEHIDLAEKLGLDSGEVKMFTMPTPLQIATALRVMNVDYQDNLLLEQGNIARGNNVDLSLALGFYLTDLGYTTVYNNTQKSISYAQEIQLIMEELPIPMYVNNGFKKRFHSNIENQDSLCKIILEGYNEAHTHISETENEALGLLVLTGAYIEGLYLATSSNAPTALLDEHENLLVQQKMFLDNILLLLAGYSSNNKIEKVVNKLSELKKAFDLIEISFNDELDTYEIQTPITSTNHQQIQEIIGNLRADIVSDFTTK